MDINHATSAPSHLETRQIEMPLPVPESDKVGALKKLTPQTPAKDNQQTARSKEDKEEGSLSAEALKEVATEINEIMDDLQTSLGFSIREELNNQVVVQIKDRKTHEIIKQIPAEELLTIKEKMEELTGLLLDHTA